MIDDPTTVPAAAPPRHAALYTVLLLGTSVLLGIVIVELSCHFFYRPVSNTWAIYKHLHGILFLDGPAPVMRNVGEIFTYQPNSNIRNLTGFFSENDFNVEYDYKFATNNFGLVQDTDITSEHDSLLLLGDSFMEGQGAEPWFRLVKPTINRLGYQAINGGLMGTGFGQWLKLERHLVARDIRIKKLVVVFISHDYNRLVRNWSSNDLNCLVDLMLCQLAASPFYRMPSRAELLSWVGRIRAARAPFISKLQLKVRIEALLPATSQVYEYLKNRLRGLLIMSEPDQAMQQSRTAIAMLLQTYGARNVLFLHIPDQDEAARQAPVALGLTARNTIRAAGGTLVDGFERCGLTPADYHPNDGHPNRDGYAKIAACTVTAIERELAPSEAR